MSKAEAAIQKLEEELDKDFVAGDIFSVADIVILYHITFYAQLFDYDISQKFPRIAAWEKRVTKANPQLSQNHKEYVEILRKFKANLPPIVDSEDPSSPMKQEMKEYK